MTKSRFRRNIRLIKSIKNNFDDTRLFLNPKSFSVNYAGVKIEILWFNTDHKHFFLKSFYKNLKHGGKKYRGIEYLYKILEHIIYKYKININEYSFELTTDYLKKMTIEEYKDFLNQGKICHGYSRYNNYNFMTNSYGIIDYYKMLGLKIDQDFPFRWVRTSQPFNAKQFYMKCNLTTMMGNIRKIHNIKEIDFSCYGCL